MSDILSPNLRGFKGGGQPKKRSKREHIVALWHEGYQASQIERITGYTHSYIYRVVEELREEGVQKKLGDFEGQTRPLRPLLPSSDDDLGFSCNNNVHAQRVRAFVHTMSPRYKKNPTQYLEGFMPGVKDVQCQGREVLIRAIKRFPAGTEEKALWNSIDWWRKVLVRLENRLGVTFLKKGVVAFEFTYHEWETTDSVVARDAAERESLWQVWHDDDGKLRLNVNWSDGPGHETFHRRDAHVDSVTFNRQVNSMLNNPHGPTIAELGNALRSLIEENCETAAGLRSVVDLLKAQVPRLGGEGSLEPIKMWYHG